MGSLKLTLRLSTCSSLLLWSAAPLLLPLRLRLSQRPRLMLTTHMPMVLTHMPMVLMLMKLTHTPMVTMERDLLRLNQRLRLMLTTDMVMDTHTPMVPTDHMLMVPTEESGDKHLESSVQIRSSKQTSITNDAQFPIFNFGEGFCHELPIKLFKNHLNSLFFILLIQKWLMTCIP